MSHCEKEKQTALCCDCPDRLSPDIPVTLNHWLTNFEYQGWRLWYDTLEVPGEDNRLCLYGRCCVCGKCLCIGVSAKSDQSTDSFLAQVYRSMYQLRQEKYLSSADFRKAVVSLFHEEDQPFVRNWLTLPENQSVRQMYRHDARGEQ